MLTPSKVFLMQVELKTIFLQKEEKQQTKVKLMSREACQTQLTMPMVSIKRRSRSLKC
jgi:hypothetical protein